MPVGGLTISLCRLARFLWDYSLTTTGIKCQIIVEASLSVISNN